MPLYKPEKIEGAFHTTYHIERRRDRVGGLVQLPVAGTDPQASVIARLHAPMEQESVYWVAVREGEPPICPAPSDLAANYNRVFLSGHQFGVLPVPTGQSEAHIHAMGGVYHYAIVNAEGLESDMPLAKLPYEKDDVRGRYVPADNFQTGILNPQSQSPVKLNAPVAITSV